MAQINDSDHEEISEIWDSVEYTPRGYFDKNFKNLAPKFLKFLLVSLINSESVDVGNSHIGKVVGSRVSYDIYNTDKQLNLTLWPDDRFELELYFYDFDDEKVLYSYFLTKEDASNIPEGLTAFMTEVRNKREPRVFEAKRLTE